LISNVKQAMRFFLSILLLSLSVIHASGQKTFYWVAGANNNAGNAANWHQGSCGGVTGLLPGVNDTIVFTKCGGTSYNCTVDVNLNVNKVDIKTLYTATIAMSAGKTFTFKTGKFNGGNFAGSDGAITSSKSFTLQGTNFTSTSGTFTVQGTFSFKSGIGL